MQEYIPHIHELLKLTSRYFYSECCSVILDILMNEYILEEDEICTLMCITTKEYNRMIMKLKEDRLIKQESKIINNDAMNNRQIVKQVYYLDYREIKEVIKYKIYMMSKKVEDEIKSSSKEQKYICKECSKIYNILELQSTMDDNYNFRCLECGGEIIEYTDTGDDGANVLIIGYLNKMVDLLKILDKYEIQRVDYFQVVENKKKMKKVQQKKEVVVVPQKDIEEVKLDNMVGDVHFDDNMEKEVEHKKIHVEITVNGEVKMFEDVTEEDKEKMTEEEYEKYYEIYSQYN